MDQRTAATQIACETIRAIVTVPPAPDGKSSEDEKARAQVLARVLAETIATALLPDRPLGKDDLGDEAIHLIRRLMRDIEPGKVAEILDSENLTPAEREQAIRLLERLARG